MIGNKTKTYFFALFSFIAISLITITSIIIGVTSFTNSTTNKTTDLLAVDLNHNIIQDRNMDNFLKERTLSLYFTNKNINSLAYSGTYGTGWIYGFDELKNDNNAFKIYVATNIHVIDNFITPDLQLNFDILFLQFFKAADDKKTYGQTTDRLFLENKYVKLSPKSKFSQPNTPNNNVPNLNYPINNVPNIKGEDGLWQNVDKNWYIQRSYSDIAILEFTINQSNPDLYHWMKFGFSNNKSPRSLNNFNFLETNSSENIEGEIEPSITRIQEYYIGGFPIINNKPVWVSKKYIYNQEKLKHLNITNFNLYKARFTTGYEMLPRQFVEGCDNNLEHNEPGLHIPSKPNKSPNNYYRNISQQILLPYTNMGAGASGSMIVTANRDIVGIWWGLYTNNKDGDYFGAGDLFIAPKDYFAENIINYKSKWPAYDNSYKKP